MTDLAKLWVDEFSRHGQCCLCGNWGIVDTNGLVHTPSGKPCGDAVFCICPNGRAMKDGGLVAHVVLSQQKERGRN